jgi:hypothetical protein
MVLEHIFWNTNTITAKILSFQSTIFSLMRNVIETPFYGNDNIVPDVEFVSQKLCSNNIYLNDPISCGARS